MNITLDEIRSNAPRRATHYKEFKSFSGKNKVLYYQLINDFAFELISDSIHIVRKVNDVGNIKPL